MHLNVFLNAFFDCHGCTRDHQRPTCDTFHVIAAALGGMHAPAEGVSDSFHDTLAVHRCIRAQIFSIDAVRRAIDALPGLADEAQRVTLSGRRLINGDVNK